MSAQSPRNRPHSSRTIAQRTEHAGRIHRSPLTNAVGASALKSRSKRASSRKRNSWRSLVAVSFFGTIIGLPVYAFLNHGRAGTGGTPALEENPKQSLAAIAGDSHIASLPARTITSGLSRATEEAALERASYQLSHGDGAGARKTYQAIAQSGSPRGAFGLAETYDPNMPARHRVWGLKSDPRLARKWYRKAAGLGSADASKRLKELDRAR